MKILTIEKINSKPVYDIEVEDVGHYILENGIISHNSGVKYANSMTVFLGKSKEKEGDEVVGSLLRSVLKKGRLTRENTQVEMKLYYDKGLDRYYGLLELAIEYGIATKAKDKEKGYRIGGQVASEKVIYSNPEKYFTEEVMKELEVAAGKKFKYGSAVTISPEDLLDGEEIETDE
jgi:hypothetical protein